MSKLLLFLLLITSLTFASKKPVVIPSVTVSASSDKVRDAASAALLGQGFRVDSESDRQIVFSKEESGGAGIMAQALMGNSNCPMPRRIVTVSIAKLSDSSTQIYGADELEVSRAYCRRERNALKGKKQLAGMQSLLESIKKSAER